MKSFPLKSESESKPCHTGGISAVTNARLYDGQDSFLIQQSMTRSMMVSRIHAWNLIGGQQTKAVSRSWLALNRKNYDVCFCIIKVIRFNLFEWPFVSCQWTWLKTTDFGLESEEGLAFARFVSDGKIMAYSVHLI